MTISERSTDRAPRNPRAGLPNASIWIAFIGYRDRSIIDLGQVEPGQRTFELLHPTRMIAPVVQRALSDAACGASLVAIASA